jgi:acyl-CoA dehydrogenase
LTTDTTLNATHAVQNPNNAGAGASDYLRMMGITVVGWMWGRMAKIANAKLATNPTNAQFYKEKLMCGRYWMERLVPETPMLLERIQAGSETVMQFS